VNTQFLVLYVGIVILTCVWYFLRRRRMEKQQKWIVGILLALSVVEFAWMLMSFQTLWMPTTYLNKFVSPAVRQWLGPH